MIDDSQHHVRRTHSNCIRRLRNVWTWLKLLSNTVINALHSPRRVEMFASISMFNGPFRSWACSLIRPFILYAIALVATPWVSNATASHIILFEITTCRSRSISRPTEPNQAVSSNLVRIWSCSVDSLLCSKFPTTKTFNYAARSVECTFSDFLLLLLLNWNILCGFCIGGCGRHHQLSV